MARKVKLGIREVDFPGTQLGEMRDSNGILDDPAAMRARMAKEGYLLIRGLYPRETILAGRRAVFEQFDAAGALQPGEPIEDGVVKPGGNAPGIMGRKGVTHEPRVRAVLEGKPIFDFFQRFLGRPALTFDYKWMRGVKQGDFTGAHYDVVYMGRGSVDRLFTVWTPFGDIPVEQGTLAICEGSHALPSFQKLRDTYGRMDVDRDRVSGWYANDPFEVVEKFGGRWLTTDFQAGDVLVFTMFTLHMSTANLTNRWRLTSDTRFQPADEPVDERWIGENPKAHYAWYSEPEKMVSMDKKKAEWGV